MASKIVSLTALNKILKPHKKTKSIGLITGCFDILHIDHIDLFKFGKSNVDILIVGIEHDTAIKKSKGDARPIHSQKNRGKVLEAIEHIDYVLLLSNKHKFTSNAGNEYYDRVVVKLTPTHLITGLATDIYTELKRTRIESVGGKLLLKDKNRFTSTSAIVEKILALDN